MNLADQRAVMLDKYDKSMTAMERPAYIRNILYGEPKCGKTKIACEIGKRPRLFAVDNGWTSLKDWPEIAARVDVTTFQRFRHFEAFCAALIKDEPIYQENDHIIFDPTSKLVREYLLYLDANAITPKDEAARVRWTRKPGAEDPDFEDFTTSGMGDYNATLKYFRKWMYPLFKINKHITLIAHVREPSFMDKVKETRAAFPGQTGAMLSQECDLISYMEADGDKRTISFRNTKKEDSGARFRSVHGKVINAEDLPRLYEKWATNVG